MIVKNTFSWMHGKGHLHCIHAYYSGSGDWKTTQHPPNHVTDYWPRRIPEPAKKAAGGEAESHGERMKVG